MAVTRKSASKLAAAAPLALACAELLAPLRGKRLAVGLSGGLDSVVLLHLLNELSPRYGYRLSAIHVNHGLSPHAADWQRFCARLCRRLGIACRSLQVRVVRQGRGLEAAARDARRAALASSRAEAIALAHHEGDQAETVLLNLLRGSGLAGASGMPSCGELAGKRLLRPLLAVPRRMIKAYAEAWQLEWIEDESNADEALTRNFLRLRVGPLLATKFPRWQENLARAARHFAGAQLDSRGLLREFLRSNGLRAPSEAKLIEMLRQLSGAGRNISIAHDGVELRVYRGELKLEPRATRNAAGEFASLSWSGEERLALPQLRGELRFRRVRGRGIDPRLITSAPLQVRLRSGGERLRPQPLRPSRTLKNLYQAAGVPAWQRQGLPLLFCGDDLVWAPGLGVDVKYLSVGRAAGILPQWCPLPQGV